MDFTAEMAQRKLAKLDNEALTAALADTAIALALRREVSPHQVLREALDAFGWDEATWAATVAPHVRAVLAEQEKEQQPKCICYPGHHDMPGGREPACPAP